MRGIILIFCVGILFCHLQIIACEDVETVDQGMVEIQKSAVVEPDNGLNVLESKDTELETQKQPNDDRS